LGAGATAPATTTTAPAATATAAAAAATAHHLADGRRPTRSALLVAAGALCVVFALGFLLRGKAIDVPGGTPTASISPKSVAVLPFLDLTTQDMNEEYFADGMTEELIDKLSKIPGLHVPGPTSSFYFKGKKAKLADIARALGVLY